jgi:hypothetical protein
MSAELLSWVKEMKVQCTLIPQAPRGPDAGPALHMLQPSMWSMSVQYAEQQDDDTYICPTPCGLGIRPALIMLQSALIQTNETIVMLRMHSSIRLCLLAH